MRYRTVSTVLSALCLAAGFAAAAHAQGFDELYRLARQEGQVDLYGGGPATIYTGWAKLFEEKFPGIKVNVTGGNSTIELYVTR